MFSFNFQKKNSKHPILAFKALLKVIFRTDSRSIYPNYSLNKIYDTKIQFNNNLRIIVLIK